MQLAVMELIWAQSGYFLLEEFLNPLHPRAGEVWGPPSASGRVEGLSQWRPGEEAVSQHHSGEEEGLWLPCVWLGGQLLHLVLKLPN